MNESRKKVCSIFLKTQCTYVHTLTDEMICLINKTVFFLLRLYVLPIDSFN